MVLADPFSQKDRTVCVEIGRPLGWVPWRKETRPEPLGWGLPLKKTLPASSLRSVFPRPPSSGWLRLGARRRLRSCFPSGSPPPGRLVSADPWAKPPADRRQEGRCQMVIDGGYALMVAVPGVCIQGGVKLGFHFRKLLSSHALRTAIDYNVESFRLHPGHGSPSNDCFFQEGHVSSTPWVRTGRNYNS